jgi:hypothetical protein
MGIAMSQNEILYLMKERIRILSQLKEIYLKKQKSVFSEKSEDDERLNELHKIFMGEMLKLEEKWRSFIQGIKSDQKIESNNADIIVSLTLHDDWVTQYFAYKDKLYQTLNEIERIKKNSQLMASKEFPFTLKSKAIALNSSQKDSARPKQNLRSIENKMNRSKKKM